MLYFVPSDSEVRKADFIGPVQNQTTILAHQSPPVFRFCIIIIIIMVIVVIVMIMIMIIIITILIDRIITNYHPCDLILSTSFPSHCNHLIMVGGCFFSIIVIAIDMIIKIWSSIIDQSNYFIMVASLSSITVVIAIDMIIKSSPHIFIITIPITSSWLLAVASSQHLESSPAWGCWLITLHPIFERVSMIRFFLKAKRITTCSLASSLYSLHPIFKGTQCLYDVHVRLPFTSLHPIEAAALSLYIQSLKENLINLPLECWKVLFCKISVRACKFSVTRVT